MASAQSQDLIAPAAIVLLGAPLRPSGAPRPALARRIDVAYSLARQMPDALVIACGGRSWFGRVEADAMAEELQRRGIESARIIRDRLSVDTLSNLTCARDLLDAMRLARRVAIVTCDWHGGRAFAIANRLDFEAMVVPAAAPEGGPLTGLRRRLHETIVTRIDLLRSGLYP